MSSERNIGEVREPLVLINSQHGTPRPGRSLWRAAPVMSAWPRQRVLTGLVTAIQTSNTGHFVTASHRPMFMFKFI